METESVPPAIAVPAMTAATAVEEIADLVRHAGDLDATLRFDEGERGDPLIRAPSAIALSQH